VNRVCEHLVDLKHSDLWWRVISRDEFEELIAYLENAAQKGDGADLRPDLAQQLLEVLAALGSEKSATSPSR
jgi:hypothetical protein